MSSTYGLKRFDPMGLKRLDKVLLKPNERKVNLYSHVKRYCDERARLPAFAAIQSAKDLNLWAEENGYTKEELAEMRVNIRK